MYIKIDIEYHSYYSGHSRIEPRHFVEPDIVQAFSKQYMFLGCIEFISKVCICIYAHAYIILLDFYTLKTNIILGKDRSIC